ncbi:MAG TPA: glycine cleavage system protein GcvH [Nitrospiria bacterium]|nr:glycine cleavage system protein GcvH [Nitrospiria bacterium]
MNPEDLKYHKEHEWVRVEGKKATVGISDYAQAALGDIVYLDIPKVGRNVKFGEEVTEIESTKTTSPLYAPVGGKIVEVNEKLKETPELINREPYGQGWVVVIEMSNPKDLEQLMSSKEYEAYLEKQAH